MRFCVVAVESCLAQGKDGELGVTGEGSLLENAQGTYTGMVTFPLIVIEQFILVLSHS